MNPRGLGVAQQHQQGDMPTPTSPGPQIVTEGFTGAEHQGTVIELTQDTPGGFRE